MQIMKRLVFLIFMLVVCALPVSALAGASPAPPPSPTNPFTGDQGPVCVAVPVFADSANRGDCEEGQEEIANDPANGGAIIVYLKMILKLLNIAIGMIIILMLIIAGVQYITSAADPGQVKAAKDRIMNAIIALVLYMLMFAILNFLIPGGIL